MGRIGEQGMGPRVLGLHAAVVGLGWSVVAFTGLVALEASDGVRSWASSLPPEVQGCLAVVLVVCGLPFLWPLYLAVGWYEADLASRWQAGDPTAPARAVRALRIQSAVVGAPGVVALGAVVAWLPPSGNRWATLAWLPFAALSLGSALTARHLARR